VCGTRGSWRTGGWGRGDWSEGRTGQVRLALSLRHRHTTAGRRCRAHRPGEPTEGRPADLGTCEASDGAVKAVTVRVVWHTTLTVVARSWVRGAVGRATAAGTITRTNGRGTRAEKAWNMVGLGSSCAPGLVHPRTVCPVLPLASFSGSAAVPRAVVGGQGRPGRGVPPCEGAASSSSQQQRMCVPAFEY
jgi:hypothetical protein